MSKKYLHQLASILEMLENIDKDLNLVSYNETEKKFIIQLPQKFIHVVNVILLM